MHKMTAFVIDHCKIALPTFVGIMAAALLLPAAAFAADTNTGISAEDARDQAITWEDATATAPFDQGDTEYWLQLDSDDIHKMSVDVPVKVVLAVNSDGSFITPTAVKNVIENNSEFPVDVSAMSIAAKDDFALKAATGFGALTDANIFNGTIANVDLDATGLAVDQVNQSVAFTKLGSYTANQYWMMGASDTSARSGDDCLFIQVDGAIANVTGHYFTAPINVFDITYTFEATPATAVGDTETTTLPATGASIAD